jgi:hypothetical protein
MHLPLCHWQWPVRTVRICVAAGALHAVLTTGVLDLMTVRGQEDATRARWWMIRMAERTIDKLRAKIAAGERFNEATACTVASISLDTYKVKRPLTFVGSTESHSVWNQLRIFEKLLAHSFRNPHAVFPAAVLMKCRDSAADRCDNHCGVVFPMLPRAYVVGKPPTDVFDMFVEALRAVLIALHALGVVHLDIYPGNVMWCMEGDRVCVKLVDWDAALFAGEPVPICARGILERNGHANSYHPLVYEANSFAHPSLDWWLFSALADPESAFWSGGSGEPYDVSQIEGLHRKVKVCWT